MKTSQVISSAALAAALFATAAFAQSPSPAPASAPNEVVYVPQLPSPSDLTGAATAQGMKVAKIDQTSDGVTVTYQSSSGQMSTIAYRPMSAAETGGSAPAVAQTAGPATTTVVYDNAGPAYYPYGYYPWGWYPAVGVRLGFGWGWHGGYGWRGGYGGFHGRR